MSKHCGPTTSFPLLLTFDEIDLLFPELTLAEYWGVFARFFIIVESNCFGNRLCNATAEEHLD